MIERCFDKDVIFKIISHPDVVDWLTDDHSDNHEVVMHPQIIYLVNSAQTGVIRIDPLNSVMCSVHIATMPELWGSGHEFAAEAIRWGFQNTLYQKVLGIIPAFNERTIKLVRDFGFKQEGLLTKSFMKRWKLHDQFIYSLNKGDSKWHL